MKKSIYSLVLADDVVEAVDRMAYEMHTSRSNLINQILAEHLSCTTPEMRMHSIFAGMETLAEQFRVLEQTSERLLSLQSRLDYKYKPTVSYFVELYRVPEHGDAGKFRVQLRTQNAALLETLDRFFHLWAEWEDTADYGISPGRLERGIRNADLPEEALGESIGRYIRLFDKYLKAWFAGIAAPQRTAQMLSASLGQELEAQPVEI